MAKLKRKLSRFHGLFSIQPVTLAQRLDQGHAGERMVREPQGGAADAEVHNRHLVDRNLHFGTLCCGPALAIVE